MNRISKSYGSENRVKLFLKVYLLAFSYIFNILMYIFVLSLKPIKKMEIQFKISLPFDVSKSDVERAKMLVKKILIRNQAISIPGKVCFCTGVTIGEIMSKSRDRHIVEARNVIFYLHRKTGEKLTEIGKCYNRDHSTVLYGIKQVDNLMQYDKLFREKYGFLVSGENKSVLPAVLPFIDAEGGRVRDVEPVQYSVASIPSQHSVASINKLKYQSC